MTAVKPIAATPPIASPDDPRLPDDPTPPVFDAGHDDLPWPQDDALPLDDDGNILPGADDTDDDPFDNGLDEQPDPAKVIDVHESDEDDEQPFSTSD
jgi:hypothetical protein